MLINEIDGHNFFFSNVIFPLYNGEYFAVQDILEYIKRDNNTSFTIDRAQISLYEEKQKKFYPLGKEPLDKDYYVPFHPKVDTIYIKFREPN